LVALSGACDSTQPLQVEEQSLALSFQAVNAITKTFNVWDVFEDNNGDELPDNGMTYLWCETVPPNQNLPPATVPWNFSVRIKILRAGETVAEVLTSTAALSATANVANYDTSAPFLGATPAKADRCTVNNNGTACPAGSSPPAGGSRFRFRNPRRQRGANLTLMTSVASPLFTQVKDDVTPNLGLGQGLCSAGNPGPSSIDGMAPPYTLTIHKGDTVIVEARMSNNAPTGGGLSALLADGGTAPNALSGAMTLDGRAINLRGTTSGRSLSFSYTSR